LATIAAVPLFIGDGAAQLRGALNSSEVK
jgi:hypothetical protein